MMKKLLTACVILVAVGTFAFAKGNSEPSDTGTAAGTGIGIVKTAYGSVSGVVSALYPDVTIFKGVPYAAPPVGDLRWQAPQDPKPWTGVRACDTYAAISPQYADQGAGSEPWKTDFYNWGEFPPVSEDCLYVNITTGAKSSNEKRPVYIWFHGGGLRHGWSYEPEFDGDTLAKKGVIVVSVGQRLGVFGYMSLPQLTKEQGHSGNYGLMDTIKAVAWVKANIAAFGGDPNNITLGGQSGGTTKAAGIVSSPLATGPQHGIKNMILESGVKWFDVFKDQAGGEADGQKYLTHLGIDTNASLESLRAMDFKVFLGKDTDDYVSNTPTNMINDGYSLKYSIMADAVDAGEWKGINILSGTNLGEAIDALKMTSAEFYDAYKKGLGPLYDQYDFQNLVKVTDANAADTFRTFATYGLNVNIGGSYSRCLMVNRVFGAYMKQVYGTSAGTYYSYLFSHFTPSRPEEAGTIRDVKNFWAWHSSEMWYAFDTLRQGVPPARPWTAYDFELAETVSNYWVNFIKTGNPNGPGLTVWPEADAGYQYLEIGDTVASRNEMEKIDQLMRDAVLTKWNIKLNK
ncbi:para-nitroBenzyl esterase (pnb carboxy-esterase)(intracellular esterase b) (pnbce) [Treponema primitia ZAS-2]|uniref:Carboxylic ester hydrolase n=1 Tax=Treponema primitia (strain ATCC BAA-887 / DSM 12427 / ZAS-2) TaxID=545694 RepID=F5YNU3_TREPZ|nr:carboxylesterase family protein [Treponema primitia]AEF85610.1 para-nitroBenzyl esterase (pnb carboxy-esterase)(intracellular esterase b) (pnbce) [Treponema primitia ZAS-2]